MKITNETRRESYDAVLPQTAARRRVILEILQQNEKGLTAREISRELFRRGLAPSEERNFAAPRLTELEQSGLVRGIGKRVCGMTGRNVTVWAAVGEVRT